MKKTTPLITLLLFGAPAGRAATVQVITSTPPAAGIPYRHTVTLGVEDNASTSRHVGAWSWEDNSLFNAAAGEEPVGWTHTSDWVALTLTANTTFTLRMERQEGIAAPTPANPANIAGTSSMFPSFTLYSGWDQDGAQDHTYNNRGIIAWSDIAYLSHRDNSTESFAENTWSLPAGNYSIALGSNAPATNPNRQGYLVSFTTVPEPGTAGLILLAAGTALRRRR